MSHAGDELLTAARGLGSGWPGWYRQGSLFGVPAPEREPYITHLVMLDNDVPSSFKTAHRAKADEALQILAAAFGLERVSGLNFGESDLAEWRSTVALWASDPRLDEALKNRDL